MNIIIYFLLTFFLVIRISSKNYISGIYTFIAKYYELLRFSRLSNFYFKNLTFNNNQFTINIIKFLFNIYNNFKIIFLEKIKSLNNTRVYQIKLTINYLALYFYWFYLLRRFFFIILFISGNFSSFIKLFLFWKE